MKIYTDGSCRGNGKTESEGGYGVVAVNNDETILFHISNGYKKQTTNRNSYFKHDLSLSFSNL